MEIIRGFKGSVGIGSKAYVHRKIKPNGLDKIFLFIIIPFNSIDTK